MEEGSRGDMERTDLANSADEIITHVRYGAVRDMNLSAATCESSFSDCTRM